jgi:hypothetical protein
MRLHAEDELKAASDQIRKEYDPILTDNAVSPELHARVEDVLSRLPESMHDKLFNEAAELYHAEGKKGTLNEAQQLQYVKSALHNESQRLLSRPGDERLGYAYGQIFHDLEQAMHDPKIGIKGYANVDTRYANTMQGLKEALDAGSKWFVTGANAMTPAEVARDFASLPDAVKPYARIGAAQRIFAQLSSKTEGGSPGAIALDPFSQEKLRTLFGDKAANKFTANQKLILNDARDLARINPAVGSITSGTLTDAADSARKALGFAMGGPADWLLKAGEWGLTKMHAPMIEHMHDLQGQDLFSPLTPEKETDIGQWLVAEQARRRAAGLARVLQTAPAATRPTDQGQTQ